MNSVFKRLAQGIADFRLIQPLGQFVPDSRIRGSKWHLDFVVQMVRLLKPRNYLEVGVYHAGLFNRVLPHVERATAIDLNIESKKFIARSSKVNFIHADSKFFWESYTGDKFDFIFIDGNHSKESVRSDFEGAISLLEWEGILMLHDTYPADLEATSIDRCDDGYLAIQELSLDKTNYEFVTIPVHPGITIVRKRRKQVPWG